MSPLSIALISSAFALGTAAHAPAAAPEKPGAPVGPPTEPAEIPIAAPPPRPPLNASEPVLAPPPPPTRRYGDRGSTEISLGLGYSSLEGFLAAGGFRTFVVDGVAPGLEATYVSGGTTGSTFGLVLASVRIVPVRTSAAALVLTGRAGRVLLSDHDDGWGVGGGIGLLLFLFRGGGVELGYDVLKLLPARFCSDLSSCVISGPVVGLRLTL